MEACVAETPAEGKQRGVLLVDVTRDEFFLRVGRHVGQVDMAGRAAGGELRVVEGLLADSAGKAGWQLAGGIDVAEENIGDCGTGFDAGAPGLENGGHVLSGPFEFERTAGEND